uniref:Uncharacterized protein n=1 Tax=Arundo donax TaxID=35708 RepID=A0A0A9F6B3_ARUDO
MLIIQVSVISFLGHLRATFRLATAFIQWQERTV